MNLLLSTVVRLYLSYFPIERGKWRLWKALELKLVTPRTGTVRERILTGVAMNLRLGDRLDRFIYFWRQWEPNETWLIQRLLQPGDTFVDVGANIGYFTLAAARIVGESGAVLAIEPVPDVADHLRQNVRLNEFRNVKVVECAVSDRDGGTILIVKRHDQNSGMNSVQRVSDGAIADELGWRVPRRRLDAILPDGPIRLIKMDIEGAEVLALKGMGERICRPDAPDLLVEVSPDYLAAVGDSGAALLSLLSDAGYSSYRVGERQFRSFGVSDLRAGEQFTGFFTKRAVPLV
jgi:FkbM family methyltransferase